MSPDPPALEDEAAYERKTFPPNRVFIMLYYHTTDNKSILIQTAEIRNILISANDCRHIFEEKQSISVVLTEEDCSMAKISL